jgi:hypothetical protein
MLQARAAACRYIWIGRDTRVNCRLLVASGHARCADGVLLLTTSDQYGLQMHQLMRFHVLF